MPGPRFTLLPLASLLAFALGCSRPEEAGWPSRNYSGEYSVRAKAGSSSCPQPVFTEGDRLTFRLVQTAENEARMDIPPIVSVSGRFTGDRLKAYGAVDASAVLSRADSSGAAASGADSIRYRLRLDFRDGGFEGTYRVEQPALGAGAKACSQEFEVRGASATQPGTPAVSG
jgi:hypothetical protein